MSWRLTYNTNLYCDDEIIRNKTLVTGEGSIQCLQPCSNTLGPLHFICTDFSPESSEDWTSGVGSIVTTLPSVNNDVEFGWVIVSCSIEKADEIKSIR